MEKPKYSPTKNSFSLAQFVFSSTGLILIVFISAFFCVAIIFQNTINVISEKEISDHVVDATGVLTRNFDRYLLIGQQLSTEKALKDFFDKPKEDIYIEHNIITTKINYDIEEVFLLSSEWEVLFQSAQDPSFLKGEEFKKMVDGVFDTNTRHGIFFNSSVYKGPLFYIVFPVNGEKGRGVLILGKVFNQEFLEKLFPSAQRGIIIFSEDEGKEVVSSNIELSAFDNIFESVAIKEAIDKISGEDVFSYKSNDKDFTGLFEIKNLRYNTFVVGTVGFFIDTKNISDMRNNFFFVAFIALLMGGILLVAVFVLTRKLITFPILQLKSGLQKVTDGDFEVKLEARGLADIRNINTLFNETVAKLREMYINLDDQVKQKTIQLSNKVEELEDSKKAVTSLLKDIEKEKAKVEETVKVRTQELNDEKARLLASINSLSFGFVMADTNNQIILTNRSLAKILEIEKIPKAIPELAAQFDKIDLVDSCKKCIQYNQATEFKNVPFSDKFLKIYCSPIISDDKVIGHIIILEDITEAKILERSKDEFFAVASHELRTPLTAIRGNSELMLQLYLEKIVDKDMKEMLVDINSASIRLINIVNEFLEVSRLEQGKIETKKEIFDIVPLIEMVIKNIKIIANKKNVSIIYEKPDVKLPNVSADKNHLEQILTNLIGNGIKFTTDGTIKIKTEMDNDFIKISVTDTGIGISDYNQQLLFRKFQQAGEKVLSREVPQGTGLGLYISQKLVENMGGTIKLEKSVLGEGSVFVFTLPIAL